MLPFTGGYRKDPRIKTLKIQGSQEAKGPRNVLALHSALCTGGTCDWPRPHWPQLRSLETVARALQHPLLSGKFSGPPPWPPRTSTPLHHRCGAGQWRTPVVSTVILISSRQQQDSSASVLTLYSLLQSWTTVASPFSQAQYPWKPSLKQGVTGPRSASFNRSLWSNKQKAECPHGTRGACG